MDLLRSLFDSKPDDLYALIWTLSDKRSNFFAGFDDALKFIKGCKERDTYIGVGLHNTPKPPERRGTREEIAGLSGLYADLDIKAGVFTDFHEAGNFLAQLPAPPTVVVNSGGGLQPWWLFKETMVLSSEEERKLAERYTGGWLNYLKERSGKKLDSVADLTRVLRVPGTLNLKYKPPRRVDCSLTSETFYNPSDFDEWLLPETAQPAKFDPGLSFADNVAKAVKAMDQISAARADDYTAWLNVGMSLFSLGDVGLTFWRLWSMKSAKYKEGDCEKKWASFHINRNREITLGSLFYWVFEDNHKEDAPSINPDPRAEISADLLDLLCSDNNKFKKTWDRKRTEFDTQYKYDCSLAGFGVSFLLDPQIIANLIIHHRRRHGQFPEEACKPGYLERIITRIREEKKVDSEREQQMHEAQSELNSPVNSEPDTTRQSLSKLFGVPIRKLLRCKADPPKYILILEDDREVDLGQINCILNFTFFREKMAAVTALVLPKSLKLKWDQFAQSLLSICEDREIGNEATDIGRAHAWINEYLDESTVSPEKQTTNLTSPYLEDERVHIIGSELRQWLNHGFGDPVTHIEMGRILRKSGCEPQTTFRRLSSGKETSRTAWRIPLSIYTYKGPNSKK